MVETIGQPIVKKKRSVPSPKEGEILIKVTVVGRKKVTVTLGLPTGRLIPLQ